jgi:hypothetical protein
MRLLNPFSLVETATNLHAIATGGGPKAVHLLRIGEPQGLIVQRSQVVVEVETRDGGRVRLEPELPMPFLLGWGIRLARKLRVPFISALEPEHFRASVGAKG